MLKGLVRQNVNKHLKIVNEIGNSLPNQVIASSKVIKHERVKAIVDGNFKEYKQKEQVH